MLFPLPTALTGALTYLRMLLSSKDPAHRLSRCQKPTWPQGLDYSIAPRWRTLMGPNWGSLLDKPSPMVVDKATKQLSIERSLAHRVAAHANANGIWRTRVVLNFPAKGKSGASCRQEGSRRGRVVTVEPLRGSDAPIQQILARSQPRRIRHGCRYPWVEQFMVQWAPEHCTFGESLEKYNLGFEIVSIASLENTVPTQDLLPFVADKRPTREHRRAHRRPPLTTS
jgi:hypothetical protein